MKIVPIKVDYIDHMGSDLSVVNAARVSFHKESKEFSNQDEKLIHYLAKHKHTSPFNHTYCSMRIKAPIFVARQLVKHKFMPWNEVSRRYVDEEPEFWFPDEWRARAENKKQGSSDKVVTQIRETVGWEKNEEGVPVPVQFEYREESPHNYVKWSVQNLLFLYNDLLDSGVAPEQARMVLPQNTMTEWIWSGTLGAWMSMIHLRLDPHAQLESQVVAKQCFDILKQYFPVSSQALLDYA